MRRYIALASLLLAGACASLGSTQSTLSVDCATQAAAVQQATSMVTRLNAAERSTIDAQIALSMPYCRTPLPADQVSASKVVQGATTRITATLAIASAR